METKATSESLRIIVTGDRDDLSTRCPSQLPNGGATLEWIQLPVLRFERLAVSPDLIDRLSQKPVEWIVFTSARAVQFWSEVLLENGVDFPVETQVACIGEQTAKVAGEDGFTPDFYPSEPGTEKFLEEFEQLLRHTSSSRPSVFIPMAEGGRLTLRDRLREWGCEVIVTSLYRTVPRDDIGRLISRKTLEDAALILFTSPSSVDAFTRAFPVPAGAKVASLGRYTAQYLREKGFPDQRMLPEGDFQRIGEVL